MRRKYFKEEILQKGKELVRERGYHNTGINDILRVCGIPKGSFYNFFESKEDFALQIIDLWLGEISEIFQTTLAPQDIPPIQRIQNVYQQLLAINEGDGYRKGCLLSNMAVEVGGLNDKMAAVIATGHRKEVEMLSACIQEGQEEGSINTSYPPQKLAEYIHNGWHGALIQMKAERSGDAIRSSLQMSLAILKP